MSLDRSTLAELLMERIYDVLWKYKFIQEDTDIQEFKTCLRQDILIQLDIIENELHPEP